MDGSWGLVVANGGLSWIVDWVDWCVIKATAGGKMLCLEDCS